jgi:hypothetical protein
MPSVEVLEKVADMAGESLDWLFGREDKTISNEERRLLRFSRGTSEEGQEIVLETVEDIFFDHPKRWWYWKDLRIRSWSCDRGATHDRDHNAAVNILLEGASSSGLGDVRRVLAPAVAV